VAMTVAFAACTRHNKSPSNANMGAIRPSLACNTSFLHSAFGCSGARRYSAPMQRARIQNQRMTNVRGWREVLAILVDHRGLRIMTPAAPGACGLSVGSAPSRVPCLVSTGPAVWLHGKGSQKGSPLRASQACRPASRLPRCNDALRGFDSRRAAASAAEPAEVPLPQEATAASSRPTGWRSAAALL
jgi:hypothetical protein